MMVNSSHQLRKAPMNRYSVSAASRLVWTIDHHYFENIIMYTKNDAEQSTSTEISSHE